MHQEGKEIEVGWSDDFLCFLFSYSPLPAALPSSLSPCLFLSPSLLSFFISRLFIPLHGHAKHHHGSAAGYGRKPLADKEAQLWLPGTRCQLPALGHASPSSLSPGDTPRGEQRTSDAHLHSIVCGEGRLAPLAAASGLLECSLWLCGDWSPGHPVCGSAAHYNCLWVSGAREVEPGEEIVERRAARLNLIRATWSSESTSSRPILAGVTHGFLFCILMYKNMSVTLPWNWQQGNNSIMLLFPQHCEPSAT